MTPGAKRPEGRLPSGVTKRLTGAWAWVDCARATKRKASMRGRARFMTILRVEGTASLRSPKGLGDLLSVTGSRGCRVYHSRQMNVEYQRSRPLPGCWLGSALDLADQHVQEFDRVGQFFQGRAQPFAAQPFPGILLVVASPAN